MLAPGCRLRVAAIGPLLAALVAGPPSVATAQELGADVHAAVFSADDYPAATVCRTCHPVHYEQWSVSPHAYTQVSPVFNAMNGTILRDTNGTLGDFCIRCHTPVGMALEEPLFASNLERAPVSVEGVTCVVCHRVNQAFGRNSGRSRIVPGDIFAPIWGPHDGSELQRVLEDPETYGTLVTEDGRPGRKVHARAEFFEPLTTASSCATCHEIILSGFREDETVSEYKNSPAAARGETCQDCHMGRVQGVAEGYAQGPAAWIGGVPTEPRRLTDHMFPGPDHSVVHPGIFPHDPDAAALATVAEWLQFDHAAGWGTDAFEDAVADDATFPERWGWPDDRYDAREILDEQLALLMRAREQTLVLLRNGFELGEISVHPDGDGGFAFEVDVHNITDGHNVPTGFVAERQVFVRATVTDADGAVVFRSGDADPNGELRISRSRFVEAGLLPRDDQLFTLQSRFVTRNLRGSEREQTLPVNFSATALPFVRPSTVATTLTGRHFSARIHKRSIEPGGRRVARYEVDAAGLSGRAPYAVDVELVVGMVPVGLVADVQDVGFDYGLSPRRIAERVVAGQFVVRERRAIVDP